MTQKMKIVMFGLLLALSQACMGDLMYTASGEYVSGTIAGIPLLNASWTITVTANPSLAQYASFAYDPGWTFWYIYATPTVAIIDGKYDDTMTLLDSGDYRWAVISYSYNSDVSFSGFGLLNSVDPSSELGTEWIGAGAYNPELSVNLQTNFQFSGTGFQYVIGTGGVFTATTSLGELSLNNSDPQAATFHISAIPEPSTLVLLCLGAAVFMRKAIAAHK